MRCCRSTPTAVVLVVSTVSHPPAKAALSAAMMISLRFITHSDSSQPCTFQGIGKKEARPGRNGGHREGESGPGQIPRPARRKGAGRPARAIAEARKKR